MLNKLNFLLILLLAYKKKHLGIFVISSLLIALVASVVFLSSSIKRDVFSTLENQADFTIQRYEAGKALNAPQAWVDEFLQINGVSSAQGRVYGTHYYEPAETHFMIVGVDFYDSQVVQTLKSLIEGIDVDDFLSRPNMIVGSGVKKFFDEYHYFDNYVFRPPDRSKEKIYIYDKFNDDSDVVSNDMIIMDVNDARKILGLEEGYVTDVILNVPNLQERETVYVKLRIAHFNARIIQKKDIKKEYELLFNYKGGVFLVLYVITLATFLLILYQRHSMIQSVDSKEVAILRTVGWKINEIIWFKLSENLIVALASYLVGIFLAYCFVYVLDAPLLKRVFLGYSNLPNEASFSPNVSSSDLALIFLIFVIPFLLAILIPLWRVSVQEPTEVVK